MLFNDDIFRLRVEMNNFFSHDLKRRTTKSIQILIFDFDLQLKTKIRLLSSRIDCVLLCFLKKNEFKRAIKNLNTNLIFDKYERCINSFALNRFVDIDESIQ